MLVESGATDSYHEPPSVVITRLLCQTIVVLTVLLGAGYMIVAHPEHASAAVALIGVCVGASFGLVRPEGFRRRSRGG